MYSFCSSRDRLVSFTGRLVARIRRNHRARAHVGRQQCRPFVRPSAVRLPSVCRPFAESFFSPPENPTDFIIRRASTCRPGSSFSVEFARVFYPPDRVFAIQRENDLRQQDGR